MTSTDPTNQSQGSDPGGGEQPKLVTPEVLRQIERKLAVPDIAAKSPRFLKRIAWRATASIVWLSLVVRLFAGADSVAALQESALRTTTDLLSVIGLAPAYPQYISRVIKFGWVLIITGFSAIEILGLTIYVLSFPILVLAYSLFRKEFHQQFDMSARKSARKGLRTKSKVLPILPLLLGGLLAWFVLYGDTNAFRQIVPAVLLAGGIFLVLVFRSIQRAKPIEESEVSPLKQVAYRGLVTVVELRNEVPKNETDARLRRWFRQTERWIYRRCALFLRGKRGKDRVASIILVDYVVSLVFLALTAIVFWAFVIKAYVAPTSLSVLQAVHSSTSYFLPGVDPPSLQSVLPLWLRLCPAMTAWILFVLYVGPAASLLVEKQNAHVRAVPKTYATLRLVTLHLGRHIRRLRRAEETLPPGLSES